MTVREAFSLAFGPMPDGATCHIGNHDRDCEIDATIVDPSRPRWSLTFNFGTWNNDDAYEFPTGPDISDRPASAFLGFFGAEYDAVVIPQPAEPTGAEG
jgi:hypothetical protein